MRKHIFHTASPFHLLRGPWSLFLTIATLVLLTGTPLSAQTTFESILGAPPGNEYPWYTWDGQQLETGNYILVSGTKGYTGLKSGILLNRLLPTGTEELSTLIYRHDGSFGIEPRTIDYNPKVVSGEIHLYIGGLMQATSAKPKAFIVRTLASGALRDNGGYYQSPSSTANSESVIAVERLALGDVVVAGTTEMPGSGGTVRQTFFATRFGKSLSTRKWSYRYTLPSTSTKNYTVKEACIGKVILSGSVAETEVLVLTGSMYDNAAPATKRSFASCINLSDGSVLWTTIANSGLASDEGLDIVQNPISREFLVVGYAVDVDAAKTKRMWVCKFGPGGDFRGGGVYMLTEANGLNMVARDVCLSHNGNRFVATGYREILNPDGTKRLETFILEMAPDAPFSPAWAKWYEKSDPSLDADESIHLAPGTAAGYFVTTGAQAILPGRCDAHAIRVNTEGIIVGGACPISDFTPFAETKGSGAAGDAFVRKTATWKFETLNTKSVDPSVDYCGTSHIVLVNHANKALALSWTGHYNTDVKFSDFLTADHTVAFRFMPQFPHAYNGPALAENGTGNYFIGQGDYSGGGFWGTKLRIAIGSKEETYSVELTEGKWYHMALVCNSEIDLVTGAVTALVFTPYLNGSPLGPKISLSPSDPKLPLKDFLRFGKRSDYATVDDQNAQFYGLIDDVAIFKKAITSSELSALLTNYDIADLSIPSLNSAKFAAFDFNGSSFPLYALKGAATTVNITSVKSDVDDKQSLPLPSAQKEMTLPFPPGEAWKVIQGMNRKIVGVDTPSHMGYAAFCWDFMLDGFLHSDPYPLGSNGAPLYAAASGKVVTVIDNLKALGTTSNLIEFQTGPNEYYGYLHLEPESSVYSVGDYVHSGLPIAKTGNVCGPNACGYHLHIAATDKPDGAKGFVTFPIAFSNYEVKQPDGSWKFVPRGIPQQGEIIRNPPIPDLPYRFVAAWQQSGEGETQVYGWKYADLKSKYDALWPEGWRLAQLQSHIEYGEVVYTAVWKQTNVAEKQAYGLTFKDYKALYDALWPEGWRIHLLDVCVLDGEPRYTAVWHQTYASEIQIYGWSYPEYNVEYAALWLAGWRLKSINSFVVDGKFQYTAVWNINPEEEIQVCSWKYDDFKRYYDELWPEGWRLAMIDIAVQSGTPYYTAVWRKSTDGEIQRYEWAYKDFKNLYNHLWKDGWRLKLLDVWSGEGLDEGKPGSRSAHLTGGNKLEPAVLFPNPCAVNKQAYLRFNLPEEQSVQIKTWDLTGKLLWAFDGRLPQGEQQVEILALSLPPGTYLVQVTTPTQRQSIKWMVLGQN